LHGDASEKLCVHQCQRAVDPFVHIRPLKLRCIQASEVAQTLHNGCDPTHGNLAVIETPGQNRHRLIHLPQRQRILKTLHTAIGNVYSAAGGAEGCRTPEAG